MAGKEQGIDDLEAVLVVLQERLKVSPNNTCVYGRSAGGLLIGGIAARHPMGGLAGKVYAEVPYVDLLKTAGNPALPLTPSEYTEFGNPMRGPAEFQEALRTSPVHRLSPIGAPGLRVVCRVGLFDRQVYPYESLKWILALRGGRPAPDDKWLVVDMAGHFEHGSSHFHAMAEDFCLIQG
jgi:oligopeptidase B